MKNPTAYLSSPRGLTLATAVVVIALFRLVPHPPNVSPVAALALFAGAHITQRWLAIALPLAAMLLSDLVLGFHPFMGVVYGAFALSALIGGQLRGRIRPLPVIAGATGASLLFFTITNFAVWLQGGFYPLTGEGLITCYGAALPFLENTLIGNLSYSALFFGLFALAERRYPAIQQSAAAC